jgi:hypothetical protein
VPLKICLSMEKIFNWARAIRLEPVRGHDRAIGTRDEPLPRLQRAGEGTSWLAAEEKRALRAFAGGVRVELCRGPSR